MTLITYTKKDVTEELQNRLALNFHMAEEVVDGLFGVLRDMLMEESADKVRIEIRNFGVFEVKPTRAKPMARNPRTNEVIHVPPRRKTHFKPGKILQEFLKKPRKGYEQNSSN
ncbi:MAG: integration host factor subunit beta [Candidatus Marinimicrobia bacterium]|nr:integration host factor subunit beta [Candidatus Neomarinimicrobiota bacterium]MDD5581794.1 integration host factor subunit beta [Candidatus Neomarinimicrobiota bacterium]